MKTPLFSDLKFIGIDENNDNDREKIDELEKEVRTLEKGVREIKVRLLKLETMVTIIANTLKDNITTAGQITESFLATVKDILLKTDVIYQTEGEVPLGLFRSSLIKHHKLTKRDQDETFSKILSHLEEEGFIIQDGLIIIPEKERKWYAS